MIKVVQNLKINQQSQEDSSKTLQPNFKANENNTYQRTPSTDTVQLENKNNTATKVGIGALVALSAAIAGDFIFAKGKHIKKLFGKAKEETKETTQNVADDATKKAKEKTEAEAKQKAEKEAKELKEAQERAARRAERRAEKERQERIVSIGENRKLVPILNKDLKDLTTEEIDTLLKVTFKDKECSVAREMVEFLSKEIAPNTKEPLKTRDLIASFKEINTDMGDGVFAELLTHDKFYRTKLGDLNTSDWFEILEIVAEKQNNQNIKDVVRLAKEFCPNMESMTLRDSVAENPEMFKSFMPGVELDMETSLIIQMKDAFRELYLPDATKKATKIFNLKGDRLQ